MIDVLLFAVAVYGWAWTLTKSRLSADLVSRIDNRTLAERLAEENEPRGARAWLLDLLNCIVCTSAWVGLALGVLHNWSSLPGLSIRTPVDAIVVVGYSVGVTWLVARATGDAD